MNEIKDYFFGEKYNEFKQAHFYLCRKIKLSFGDNFL